MDRMVQKLYSTMSLVSNRKENQSNINKLLADRFRIQCFEPVWKNDTVAVQYINRMEGKLPKISNTIQ
jgi:hypothetical protein